MLTALLLAAHVVSSPTLRKKIRQTVAERTGAEIDWQAIGLSYFPTPAITLQQVVLAVPDRLQGRVAELRLAPEILPLMTGKLRLARLRLERPEISLDRITSYNVCYTKLLRFILDTIASVSSSCLSFRSGEIFNNTGFRFS